MADRKAAKPKPRATSATATAAADNAAAGSSGSGNFTAEKKRAAGKGAAQSPTAVGEGGDAPRASTLLNLEVKVLTQALGAENQWVERGDGRVEFADFVIRVVANAARTGSTKAVEGTTPSTTTGGPSPSSSPASTEANISPVSDAVSLPSTAAAAGSEAAKADGAGGQSPDGAESVESAAVTVNDESLELPEDNVILEDTITGETPFVGENCCIVWNSFEQQLSLCLMYASEEGYAASWSALVALQDKAYPPFRVDLLHACLPLSERGVSQTAEKDAPTNANEPAQEDGSAAAASSPASPGGPSGAAPSGTATAPAGAQAAVLPYAYFIHDKYQPPLGFIEQHALSLCIIEHGHALRQELYADRQTVLALLNLANADLLEHFLAKDVYPMLAKGLGCPVADMKAEEWTIPASLSDLTVPEELSVTISKDLRLGHLQQRVLRPADDYTELLLKLSTISHQLRNELTCSLLSSDVTLQQAREALTVAPPPLPAGVTRASRQPVDGRDGPNSPGGASADSGALPAAYVEACRKAEAQVLAHMQFFRSLVGLSIAELGKELVGPVVVKVFQSGLLQALSLVAERFAMPSGVTTPFLHAVLDNSSNNGSGAPPSRRTAPQGPNWYSPAIEAELTMLLDLALVRLNERQEEQLMNELVRVPILNEPATYNGIVTFMLRQLALSSSYGGAGSIVTERAPTSAGITLAYASTRVLHESMSTRNPNILFHVLGLHDDEGSAAAERALDPESTAVRNRFQSFIITKYLSQASRGSLVPVPQPPSGGSGAVAKSTPIVQFSNSTGLHSVPQGISPAFVRLLEYLIVLSTAENREVLLRIIFSHKSHVLQYIEGSCEVVAAAGTTSKAIGLDVLSSNMRFLRTIMAQIALTDPEPPENPIALLTLPQEPVSKGLVTMICRQLTVERDTFGSILRAYHRIGGTRRNTIFHSSVLSLLEMIDRHASITKDSGDGEESGAPGTNNDLHDIRDYLFLRHLRLLPGRFEKRYREALLAEVSSRLGRSAYTPNDSVSVLSSTASEMLRSSSKLRFVDEVEAATGGVDGTVVPETVASLSPVVVGNVHNTEEKHTKKYRSTMELLAGGSGSSSSLPGAAGGGSSPGGSTTSAGSGNSPTPFRPISPSTSGHNVSSPSAPTVAAAAAVARTGGADDTGAADGKTAAAGRGPSPPVQPSPPTTPYLGRPRSANSRAAKATDSHNGSGSLPLVAQKASSMSSSPMTFSSGMAAFAPAGTVLTPQTSPTTPPHVLIAQMNHAADLPRERREAPVEAVAENHRASPKGGSDTARPESAVEVQEPHSAGGAAGGRHGSSGSPPSSPENAEQGKPVKNSTAPSSPNGNGSGNKSSDAAPAEGGETLVLPKIRKRAAPASAKR